MKTLHVCKGKVVTTIDLPNAKPDDKTLAELMLGPTGNLRAPTLKIGKTLVVGFNEEIYSKSLL